MDNKTKQGVINKALDLYSEELPRFKVKGMNQAEFIAHLVSLGFEAALEKSNNDITIQKVTEFLTRFKEDLLPFRFPVLVLFGDCSGSIYQDLGDHDKGIKGFHFMDCKELAKILETKTFYSEKTS